MFYGTISQNSSVSYLRVKATSMSILVNCIMQLHQGLTLVEFRLCFELHSKKNTKSRIELVKKVGQGSRSIFLSPVYLHITTVEYRIMSVMNQLAFVAEDRLFGRRTPYSCTGD